VEAEKAGRRTSWLEVRGFGDKALSMSLLGLICWSLMAYPAYRGLRPEGFGEGPRVLTQPVPLGDLASLFRRSGLVRAGSDCVVTIFVPVDPAYHYTLVIREQFGRVLYRAEDASPFDGIGTFAVLLPAGGSRSRAIRDPAR
jgi:hypothetical protein